MLFLTLRLLGKQPSLAHGIFDFDMIFGDDEVEKNISKRVVGFTSLTSPSNGLAALHAEPRLLK